jgi:FkbM family methyltransferase
VSDFAATKNNGPSALALLEYLKNRAKDLIRPWIPAHRRFLKEGRAFLVDGEREVHELPSLIEPGTVAVDVGSHLGSYTYALCRLLGADGQVIAIEPIPDLAGMLSRAARKLNLPVVVHNCALSSTEGQADLLVPVRRGKKAVGFASLERKNASAGQLYRVPVRRLDDLCRDVNKRISFIKIDVEGHELKVLAGGTETLRRHRPNLLIEIEQRHSPAPIGQTFSFLTSMGYRGEFLDPEGARIPLEEFDVEQHQTRRLDQVGTRYYVSNFIFRWNGNDRDRSAHA